MTSFVKEKENKMKKKNRIEIKGEERKQLGIWWREVRKILTKKCPKCRSIPRFTDVKVYFVLGDVDFWGQTTRIRIGNRWENESIIEISEEFLKAFGDKLDIVVHMFKHEVVHFVQWNHDKRFLELMKFIGFQDKHTPQYILREYSDEFYGKRWKTKKRGRKEGPQRDYRKGKKLWDF